MSTGLEYRVTKRARYAVVRLEQGVDERGLRNGSFRIVGEYDSADDAERVKAALQAEANGAGTSGSEARLVDRDPCRG